MIAPELAHILNITIALLVALLGVVAVNLLLSTVLWIRLRSLENLIKAARRKSAKTTPTPNTGESLAPVSPGEDKYKRPIGAAPRYIPYGVMVTLRGKKVKLPLNEVEE
jgi:hypothetical protein